MNSTDNSILDELIGGLCIGILTLISDHLSHVFFSSLIFQFVFKCHTEVLYFRLLTVFRFYLTFEANNSWKQKMHCLLMLCLILCFKFFGTEGCYLTVFFFSLIYDLAGLFVVILLWKQYFLCMSIISGGKGYTCSIQSSPLKFLSFCYFVNCNYQYKKKVLASWWRGKTTKTPRKNVLKTIWKRCENLTRICYYVLRTFRVLNQNVL